MNNKSALELFEQIGFRVGYISNIKFVYVRHNKQTNITEMIVFNTAKRKWYVSTNDNTSVRMNIALFEAISKQIEELKWEYE